MWERETRGKTQAIGDLDSASTKQPTMKVLSCFHSFSHFSTQLTPRYLMCMTISRAKQQQGSRHDNKASQKMTPYQTTIQWATTLTIQIHNNA
jgi:hypothetical protein